MHPHCLTSSFIISRRYAFDMCAMITSDAYDMNATYKFPASNTGPLLGARRAVTQKLLFSTNTRLISGLCYETVLDLCVEFTSILSNLKFLGYVSRGVVCLIQQTVEIGL